MKLNQPFKILPVCGTYCATSPDYQGVIGLNETSAYIFELLSEETTEEKILDALCERYEAPREVMAEDLKELIKQTREAGLLTE